MKRILNIFAAVLVALAANAAVININTATSDALRKALNTAATGDTIVMAAGLYVESNSDYIAFTGKEVVVMAEKGADVTVQPKVPVRLKTGARAEFINIKFDCGHLSDLAGYSEIIVPADGTANKRVFLDGCEFFGWKQKSNAIIHTRSDRQLDTLVINNCYFHDNLYNCVSLKYPSIACLSITNSTFANITTDANAPSLGVIDVQSSTGPMLIDHCTFYNCQTKNTDYGAVRIPGGAPVVSNCVFAMPEEYTNGRAVYNAAGEVNNCLTYNYASDDTTGIHSGPTVTACFRADPLFRDAAHGDLHVTASSPVMGAGTDGSDLGDPRWIPTLNYYLVGIMTGWMLNTKLMLEKNPANEAEYIIPMTFYAGQEFKIVLSDGYTISETDWYPSGLGTNYIINASGDYTVYFRPDGQGGEGWHHGYIYAQMADIGPWETYFGDANWQPEYKSYLSYDPASQKATVYIREDKDAQWKAQAKYHGISAEDGKCYHVALKMKANRDITGVTLKWQDDNNTPNVIYENKTINLGAETEFVYNEVVAGVVGEQGSNGILVLDFGFAKLGDIIEIYDVVIEETVCPAPPIYYLVGSMTEWATAPEYLFAENPDQAGEFFLTTTLAIGDAVKVVGVQEQKETWYPNGFGNEYVVDAAHAGETTVYFRPAGNPDWAAFGGYFFIPDNGQGIEEISQEPTANSQKLVIDGQLFIRRDGKIYTTTGVQVK